MQEKAIMSDVHRFRMAMARLQGEPITADLAARLEVELFAQPAADLRKQLCVALARFADRHLTREVALEIVGEVAGTDSRDLANVPGAALPIHPTRDQIAAIEAYILQGAQVETPTTHFFAPGLYARQMFIPAGTVLTGAVHKVEHLAIFVGDITVWTEEGMKRLTGHHTFISKPGAKRVGYAHADTWCTGFFSTDKTDVAELERDLVETPHLLQCNRPSITDAATHAKEN